jgi:uncharacterized OB-fold protein
MSDNAPARPLPDTRNAGKRYWEAAAKGVLLVPKCLECGSTFWHPRPRCPHCGSDRVDWIESSGNGTIHTFTVVRQSSDPYFKSKLPYAVAMVELAIEQEQGPRIRIMSNVIDCPLDTLHIGMPVAVVFEQVSEQVAIPLFRPRAVA